MELCYNSRQISSKSSWPSQCLVLGFGRIGSFQFCPQSVGVIFTPKVWGLLLEYGISEVSIERLVIRQVLSSLVEQELQYLPNTCSLWNLCLAVSLSAALLHQKFHSLTLWIHSTKVSRGFERNFCTELYLWQDWDLSLKFSIFFTVSNVFSLVRLLFSKCLTFVHLHALAHDLLSFYNLKLLLFLGLSSFIIFLWNNLTLFTLIPLSLNL